MSCETQTSTDEKKQVVKPKFVCAACGEPAKLECPTCKNLKLRTHFCGKACFQKSWAEHNKIHTCNTTKYKITCLVVL